MQFRKASTKTNKDEIAEKPPTKHRRKAVVLAEVPAQANAPAVKAKAAAAGATSASEQPAPTPVETGQPREIRHEEIAKLAHSYWVARGYRHGSPHEDWLRAERELKTKR